MEESLREEGTERFFADILEGFSLKATDPGTYSPLVLAWIGDGIYELIIRSILIAGGNMSVDRLNRMGSRMAKAAAQAGIYFSIREELTEEEEAVFRRGRNAKSYSMAKNASVNEYRHATGLEALCGFLYLNGKTERLLALLRLGFERSGMLEPGGNDGIS